LAARLVERHAGTQVHGATEATFDDLCRRVLVHVHACHQLGRYFLEAEAAPAVGAEHVASIQFATHLGQAADPHATAYGGEVVGIVTRRELSDGDATDALEGFGDAAIGQRANVVGRHRIHDLGRFLLDLLGTHDAAADARHYDGIEIDRFIAGGPPGILGDHR